MRRIGILALLLLGGCATSFRGSAHVPNGPSGCYQRCEADGLQMTSFVYLGEFSTGCVCSVRGASASADGPSAVGPGAVGVVLQMREQERSRN